MPYKTSVVKHIMLEKLLKMQFSWILKIEKWFPVKIEDCEKVLVFKNAMEHIILNIFLHIPYIPIV